LQKNKIFAKNEEISLKIQVTVQVSHTKLAAQSSSTKLAAQPSSTKLAEQN
jgi:hypothetical protein